MKRIRLEPSAYQQGHCFSLSIAAAKRTPRFVEASTVCLCLGALEETAKRFNARVFAYCFMPDHLHLLVAMPAGSDLVQFVRHFKQISSYRCRQEGSRGALWQARFYDHALRREENLVDVARYVWENPVRAGLAENTFDYPYSGSFAWEEEREPQTVGV